MTNGVFLIDPLRDARWDKLLERHPSATVFHSGGWLEALKLTYGYEPLALTTTREGPLENGLVLSGVKTWRSRRLVSLPFSDHCDPLLDRPEDLSAMLGFVGGEIERKRWRSIELRPRTTTCVRNTTYVGRPFGAGAPPTLSLAEGQTYYLHTLDLARPADEIFHAFHHSSTQRAIRRAEREGLAWEAGSSERLLESFYGLLRQARRRHGLPPQPLAWFRNLAGCLGDRLRIHVASHEGRPIASILTLTFKKTLVYKYGGSDAVYHPLGGMPFLFWHAILAAKADGLEHLDLGRSDIDQPGLVRFKDHLGARRTTLTYFTSPARHANVHDGPLGRVARRLVAHLPDAALDLTGRLLYRHFG
jgi:hypothetical protein